jgi:hypothetical protein
MQQPCKTCGYESPDTDKFCRQCGGQLPMESDFTSATTLNHGRVDPNPPMASVGTGRFHPSVSDAIAANTERYYAPPQYAPDPANIERPPTFMQFTPVPAPPSRFNSFSRFMKGVFTFLLVAALLVTTGVAVFFSQEATHARRELSRRDRSRDGMEQANGRAQDAWEKMELALQLTNEVAERAANAGATLMISGERPIDLSKYAYPDAQVEAMIGRQGNEALSMITHKSFEDVQKFYEGMFGKPVIQVAAPEWENRRKKQLFQSPTPLSILVKVEEIDRGRVKITILHSFLRFPRFNEVQAQNVR